MMKYLLALLCCLSLSTSLQADEVKECLDKDEAEAIMKEYSFLLTTKYPMEEILCDKGNIIKQTIEGIKYLDEIDNHIRPSSNAGVLDQGFKSYFKRRVKVISFDSKGLCSSDNGVVAYATGDETNIIHICESTGKHNYSPFELSSTLIHEARHLDGYWHVSCTHGEFQGRDLDTSGSCDDDLESLGSYGIEVSYAVSVSQSDLGPIEKQSARSIAATELTRRFNKLPLNIKPGIAIQSASGVLSFFNGVQKTELLGPGNLGIMVNRTSLPTFFNQDGTVKSYSFSTELIDTAGSFAKAYRDDYSQEQQVNLLDVYYGGDYSCMLFISKLECSGFNDEKIEIDVSSLSPLKILFQKKEATLRLSTKNGDLYTIPMAWDKLRKTKKLVRSAIKKNILSVAAISNMKYELDFSGKFFMRLSNGGKKIVEQYKNENLKKLFSPFYWSKELEDL